MRPESGLLRALRIAALEARALRAADLLALIVVGSSFGLVLALVVGGAVSLLDWLDGRPNQVWRQVAALMAWMD